MACSAEKVGGADIGDSVCPAPFSHAVFEASAAFGWSFHVEHTIPLAI
jgi:hypothetical protein